jgi:predicted exporter
MLCLLLATAGWQSRNGWPVSSDLLDLLPASSSDALTARAEARAQEPLSRQLIALAGHADAARAVRAARDVAAQWKQSNLFTRVDVDVNVDLDAVRRQLLGARLSAVGAVDRALLHDDPATYIGERALGLTDPFKRSSLIPLDQDWLGLAHSAEQALTVSGGLVAYDLASGTLQAESDGKVWVMIRAQTRGGAFDQAAPKKIGALVASEQARMAAEGTELIATGGVLYAAAARGQAIKESSWMGAASVLAILVVLLVTLRRARALLALAPIAVAMLSGFVACVALFGSVHVLTLVIGASLIGVAVDYPMHWLGKSYGMTQWHAWPALRRVRAGLSLSLATSLIGYTALALTPFPALTQSAVFSVAGLLGAYACTVCLLPAWFDKWQPRPYMPLRRAAQGSLAMLSGLMQRRRVTGLFLLIGVILCAGGIARLSVHDDMRLWLAPAQALADQSHRIGTITGLTPTSQFFLVRADNTDALLERQAELALGLDMMVDRGELDSYRSLSQLHATPATQHNLRQALIALSKNDAALTPLLELGVPSANLQSHIDALAAGPSPSLQEALAGPLGEPWRPLWLGENDGVAAGMITLQGLRNVEALSAIAAAVPGAMLVDRSADLNTMFSSTRIEAAELKLASYLIAGLLLWAFLGRGASWRILAVPFAATVCSLAVLGYIGQPLNLFSLFGLLLVSAIGVDYAIFMYEQIAGAAASLVGIMLGGLTTLASFGMLAFSSTPAIASFGLAVATGVTFSLLWAPWVRNPVGSTHSLDLQGSSCNVTK